MNNDLKKLNSGAVEQIDRYINLDIHGLSVRTPYYINNIQFYLLNKVLKNAEIEEEKIEKANELYSDEKAVPHGWYIGKGSPQQLQDSVIKISKRVRLPLNSATEYGVREFMKLFGLGVDCSGFAYHVLLHAFNKVNRGDEYIQSLNWRDEENIKQEYAGTFIFTRKASTKIEPKDIKPLDLLLIRKGEQYPHIGVFVKKDGDIMLAQSSIDIKPSGVTVTDVSIDKTSNQIQFNYQPSLFTNWNEKVPGRDVEIRRLKILT
jgi:hypothetical protein